MVTGIGITGVPVNMGGVVAGLNAAQLGTFLPGAIGGEMNLALQLEAQVYEDTDGVHALGATVFFDKYGITKPSSPLDDDDDSFIEHVQAKVAPRFTSALLDATKAAREAKTTAKAISDYLEAEYNTVPFDDLEAAGLVTHSAVSDYLKLIHSAVLETLTPSQIADSFRKIKRDGEFVGISIGGVMVGLACALSSVFTLKVPDGLPGYGENLLIGGLLVVVASVATATIFGDKKENHKAELQNASQALVALERQLKQINEKG